SNAWSAPDEKNSPGFAWKDGAEIYAKICAYCHEAQVGPHIRNRNLPAAYIRAVVRNGNRAMPAFRPSEIDDESLIKLADFISKKEAQH
ncbi:MAG: cytochrome c, partial [Nitrosomonas sp.]|nr:cytochrome c [Nitrosomonas sp.]